MTDVVIHRERLRPPKARSRLSNGSVTLADGRSVWARRFRDLTAMHVQDLGGPDNISEAERAILRRACVLMIELERLEQRFAEGEADTATIDLYQRGANSMRRLLESLGLKRRAKEVNGVTLGDLMRESLDGEHR
jgi:hypothetical protein